MAEQLRRIAIQAAYIATHSAEIEVIGARKAMIARVDLAQTPLIKPSMQIGEEFSPMIPILFILLCLVVLMVVMGPMVRHQSWVHEEGSIFSLEAISLIVLQLP
ncbi:MAG: hypothetical protein ACRECG_00285 [Bradyrhizobium sp.]